MSYGKVFCMFASAALACSCGNDFEEYVPPQKQPGTGEPEEIVYHERAKEVYELIDRYYRISSGSAAGLYGETYPNPDGTASTLWPYDGFVSGAAALVRLGYDIDYQSLVDRFSVYYRTSGAEDVGGYGSATDGFTGSGDRFFDDNSIVGLDLVEAYRITGKQEYLDQAAKVVRFLQSGEDDVFGGGLWWNESLKNVPGNENSNKPACSNSFATLFLLEYWSVTGDPEALEFAKRLYKWVTENLRDPSDGVYWNDRQASGNIREVKYTYNTGAMISNGVRLFRITGDQQFLDDAVFSADGAYNYFVRPNAAAGLALAYPDHDPWFTTKLIKAFIDIEPYHRNAGNYIGTFTGFLDNAYEKARTDNGLFCEDWTGTKRNAARDSQLLMQDAVLESLGVIALYKNEKAVE